MKYTQYTFSEFKELILIPIGDFHIGSPYFLEPKLDSVIDFVKNTKNAYLILLGDLIDNAVPNSVGNVFENIIPPQEQLDYLLKKLSPVSNKVLGIVSGNHEYRTFRRTGLDVMNILSEFLDCEFDENILVLDISVGSEKVGTRIGSKKRVNYIVQVSHGYGGGRTHGGKLNNAVRFGQIVLNADIVITGHSHGTKYAEEAGYLVDKKNKGLTKHTKHYIVASSLLDYESYAQKRAYTPNANSITEIHLSGLKKEIRFTIKQL